jgi:hypothetical protein
MNYALNLLIATLITLGILMTEADWNNLSSAQQEQYKTEVVGDDPMGF